LVNNKQKYTKTGNTKGTISKDTVKVPGTQKTAVLQLLKYGEQLLHIFISTYTHTQPHTCLRERQKKKWITRVLTYMRTVHP